MFLRIGMHINKLNEESDSPLIMFYGPNIYRFSRKDTGFKIIRKQKIWIIGV